MTCRTRNCRTGKLENAGPKRQSRAEMQDRKMRDQIHFVSEVEKHKKLFSTSLPYGLFTPPTRTRQIGDQTKQSCLVCSCVHTANSTRQDSFVWSNCHVFTSPTRTRQNWVETRQNCLVSSRRRCKQAIR